ncbi:MAG: hypothetical protein IKQ30_14930 [Bacteroidales bacterium]|nr:hypothetical protein [Bacteroidales bacterium]MBR4274117.1 hypothetical protein [Bacteroidales bacterium]
MVALLAYTVEVGVVFAVLIAIYRHVYYGISYNKWERGYLLAATAASYLLPLLKAGYVMRPVPKPTDHIVEIVQRCSDYDVVTLSRPKWTEGFWDTFTHSTVFENIIAVLFAVYVAGVAVKLFSFVRGLMKSLRLKARSQKVRSIDGVDVYNTDVNTVAFSFFGNIFLGAKSRGLSDAEMDIVIRHEMQHVAGRHSVDTLVFGLYSVLQWWNPMARLAARYSRIVCENIADSQAVGDGKLTEYSKLVLGLGIKNCDESAAVAIRRTRRKSPLVDRIAQLLNTDSVNIRRIRFYAALPVLAVAIAAYIAYVGMLTPIDPRYDMPVRGGYEVVAGFFNDQKICNADGKVYVVSHKLVNLCLADGAVIVPPAGAGNVQRDANGCKFCIGNYTVTIEGIAVNDNENPASLIVTDQKGNAIDPQLVFKL